MKPALAPELTRAFESPAASRFMARLFALPRFAHHPDCHCFDAHVLRFGPLVLCLGCTSMSAGAIAGAVCAATVARSDMAPSGWIGTAATVSCGVLLYAPTLAQPFCQRKTFKIVARTLLGLAVVCLWIGGMMLPPIDAPGVLARLVFVLAFRQVYVTTLSLRATHTPDPCLQCGTTTYPFCKDNQPRVAHLVADLRRTATPADAAFVEFAAQLAGVCSPRHSVDILQQRSAHADRSRGCHPARR